MRHRGDIDSTGGRESNGGLNVVQVSSSQRARTRPVDVAAALVALRSAQKPPHGTPAYSRFVNRPVGRQLAARAAVAGLTPNQISGISAVCSLTGILLIATTRPQWWTGIVVALLLALGYAFDSADGQVARLTGLGSRLGEWLDHMIDCAKTSALHMAVTIALVRFSGFESTVALVGFAYLLTANVLFFGMMLMDQLRRGAGRDSMAKTGSLSVARSIAILPSDYGFLCLGFALLPWPSLFLTFYALMCLGCALLLAAACISWVGALRAMDRSA